MGVTFCYITTLPTLGEASEVNGKWQKPSRRQLTFLNANVNTAIDGS